MTAWATELCVILVFVAVRVARPEDKQKTEVECPEGDCSPANDVCEPMVLRQNIEKRGFLLFCNFTKTTEDTFYEVEFRRTTWNEDTTAATALTWITAGRFNSTGMKVEKLQPYTRYAVRVVEKRRSSVLGVSNTIFISTKAAREAPADSPREVYITSPDPGVIAVAWKEPMLSNSPLLEYQLILETEGKSVRIISVKPEVNFHQITSIPGGFAYKVLLRAKNRYGMGPAFSGEIFVEKPKSEQSTEDTSLLCVSRRKLSSFKTMFMYDEELSFNGKVAIRHIIDITVDLRRKLAYIVDNNSQIFKYNMTDKTITKLWRSEMVVAMDFDWLNKKLFILHGLSISMLDVASIKPSLKVVPLPFETYIMQGDISVDPLNGYLFLMMDGKLYSADLPSNERPRLGQFSRIGSDLIAFNVNPSSQTIFMANSTTLTSISYDWARGGKQKTLFQSKKSKKLFAGDLVQIAEHYYFVSREKQRSQRRQSRQKLGILEYSKFKKSLQYHSYEPSIGSLRHLISLSLQSQPLPVPYRPPEAISAVCWRTRCDLSWRPPAPNAGAGKSAWQKWGYTLRWDEIDSSTGASHATVVPHFRNHTVANLTPGRCYSLRVAATIGRKEGPYSRPAVACTSKFDESSTIALFYVRGRSLRFQERSTDGRILNRSATAMEMKFTPQKILSRGHDLWSIDTHGGIHHLRKGRWKSLTMLPRADVFVVEYLTGTLYFVSAIDKWIYRWRNGWSKAELLIRSSRVAAITLDATEPNLYWCSDRTIHRSGLHGENASMIYSLPQKMESATISNVIWDANSERLLFLVRSEYVDLSEQLWQLTGKDGKHMKAVNLTTIGPIRRDKRLIVIGSNVFWEDQTFIFSRHLQANLTGKLMDNITAFHMDLITNSKNSPRDLFPCDIDPKSIGKTGNDWRRFRLKWGCKGNLSKRLKFKVKVGEISRVTKKLWIELHDIAPHSRLNVSIQPVTRWIRGPVVRAVIQSPFGAPRAPHDLRLFYRFPNNLVSGKTDVEGQACWKTRDDASRPFDYFRLRLVCSDCDRKWKNISEREKCFPFASRRHGNMTSPECVEIQACSRAVGCSPNTSVECAGDTADVTLKIESKAKEMVLGLGASSSAIFWSENTLLRGLNKTLVFSLLVNNANRTMDRALKRNATIQEMGADWLRNQLFWTEEKNRYTTMWKSNLNGFSKNLRRLQTYRGYIRNLTILSISGLIQWHLSESNQTFEERVASLRGLSAFANSYPDDSTEKCEEWTKASIVCDHPDADKYRLMVHPQEDKIIEYSEPAGLCRHLKIKGNAQSHSSLGLIQRCFVEPIISITPSSTHLRIRRRADRSNLRTGTTSYSLAVLTALTSDRRALSIRRDSGEMVSAERHRQPFQCRGVRGSFLITECGPRQIRIRWLPPKNDSSIVRALVQYLDPPKEWGHEHMLYMRRGNYFGGGRKSVQPYKADFRPVQPNKVYKFRLGLIICNKPRCINNQVVHEPSEDAASCECRTRADIPERPSKPNYQHMDSSNYRITWDKPEDHGSEIFQYLVDQTDGITNKTETKKVEKESVILSLNKPTDLQIRAQNEIGVSQPSPKLRISPIARRDRALMGPVVSPVVVGLAAALFFILIAIIIGTFCWYRRKRSFDHRRSHLNQLTMQMEMRNLSGSPGPTEVNALYANATKMEAIERLPRISRHQLEISSNKYLGAGAFGQVWEGVAKGLFPDDPERCLAVAMKTLRRGATSQEREDFLQEAQLMSNFNHDHIVRLLGVCLEGEPQFIILELMNKGDLKSYLRAARPSLKDSLAALSVPNLLGIIIDVAKGCSYLEEQHFVHRDIAARNCLVTYLPDGTRVTKIGDFGLARDVYRSDYYRNQRKEAMLPVRWMSPEALVDGLFSSQSDVWAYGVLCWEVMTLGQQPYAARTHSQVMRFVRAGGILDRPSACPDQLYQLMVLCWSFSTQLRPTFLQILNSLYGFQTQTRDPYSPFSQPFYFQNYVTQDMPGGATGGTATHSSGDSSECASNLLCPGVGAFDQAGDEEENLCVGGAGASCYETPLSRPYLDVQPDMTHYVNSRIVVAMPPLHRPPSGARSGDRSRPLSIDNSRASAAQVVSLGPPPPQPAMHPSQAMTMRHATASDINYRSIRVEEPESSEYQVPDPSPMPVPMVAAASAPVNAAAAASYATPMTHQTNGRGSAMTSPAATQTPTQTATLRSTASSSNGESSMTASTGSRSSGVLPTASAVGAALAVDSADPSNNNNKSAGVGIPGRPAMGVQQATAAAAKASSDYASRHYDRL